MAHYRGTAERPDKAKAMAGVVLVHAALAAVILSGLSVHSVSRAVERLKTFDIRVPPPPPPRRETARHRDQEGAAAKKAAPTPIVAPRPAIVLPATPPVVAAPVAADGAAATAGAGMAGSGSGAGGSGNGLGGGGSGDVPARWLSGGLDDGDNRGGRFEGVVAVRFTVLPTGRIARCRATRPSGDGALDALTCRLLEQRLRFAPARDSAGRAVASELGSTFTWGVRRRRAF